MRSVRHFIITRFNLRAPGAAARLSLDRDWLSRRFALFERFCLPTVVNQTNQDFRWLVLFDAETPELFRARMRDYERWTKFIPVFLPAGTEQVGRKVVLDQLETLPDLLVTTRLDNDDGLCQTFVADLRKCVDVTTPTILEFPVGYVWHRNRIYLDRQPHNPFTTLIEPLDADQGREFTTIYRGSHSDISRLGRVVEVTQRPSWIQVIHGGNLENRLRGVRRPIQELSDRFDIDYSEAADRENRLLRSLDTIRSTLHMRAIGAWQAMKPRPHR